MIARASRVLNGFVDDLKAELTRLLLYLLGELCATDVFKPGVVLHRRCIPELAARNPFSIASTVILARAA